MKLDYYTPVFVDAMPEDIEPGQLYISVRFRTASHLCACGCGLRVVTPIKPTKWSFEYNGESVSLAPSIGRWQLPCKSHYWIRNNRVHWSRPFTEKQIERVLERDARDLKNYYESRQEEATPEATTEAEPDTTWLRSTWKRFTSK